MSKTLEYRLVQDYQHKPLVIIESSIGNGFEIHPDALRSLAAALLEIADEAESDVNRKSKVATKRFKAYGA